METSKLVFKQEWLVEYLYKISGSIADKVNDATKFEEQCIKDLSSYLSQDRENKNNRNYLRYLIQRNVPVFLERYRREKAVAFTILDELDDSGDLITFEPRDERPRIDASDLIAKEMAALLAQDDRDKMIVDMWADGYTNDSEISRALARSFGGNANSYRRYIQRFRQSCQRKLAPAI